MAQDVTLKAAAAVLRRGTLGLLPANNRRHSAGGGATTCRQVLLPPCAVARLLPLALPRRPPCCRAATPVPLCVQLWHAYLSERLLAVRGLGPTHPAVESLNNTFERAMVSMHKMPRIWILYLEFMLTQKFISRTRRLFDRALTSLPVTQHERVWPLYLRFIGDPAIPMETAVRVCGCFGRGAGWLGLARQAGV